MPCCCGAVFLRLRGLRYGKIGLDEHRAADGHRRGFDRAAERRADRYAFALARGDPRACRHANVGAYARTYRNANGRAYARTYRNAKAAGRAYRNTGAHTHAHARDHRYTDGRADRNTQANRGAYRNA